MGSWQLVNYIDMRNINLILFCLLFSSCKVQNTENRSDALLSKIYNNQLEYFNTNIVDKDNYVSIINFSKQERNKIINQTKGIINSDSFYILEGFSPSWGNFIGLVWNKEIAYSYKRSSTDIAFNVTKVNLNDKKIKKTGIDFHIIDRINHWDVAYINGLKRKIGMGVSDGYNFIATKVMNAKQGRNPVIETISFEQFTEEK